MNLYQTLVTAVSRINSHKLEDLDRIKHTVIIPILRALNWDDTNPDVFWPNYQVNHCLFDFALLFSDTPFVLIKCCQFKDMEKGELNYLFKHANDEGVGSLILTNGYQWDFFHSKVKDMAKFNQYFSIDLTKDDQFHQYTKYLNLFLGYDSVMSSEAKIFAEKFVSQIFERKKTKEMVEIAWDSILEGPDELLVDLLFESVVSLCGIKPEVEYIKTYLRGKRDDPRPTIIDKPDTEKIIISPKDDLKLFHTRLTSAKFGDFRPAKLNWKSIQLLALTSVLDVCKDLEELRHISQAEIVKDHKTDKGYVYVPSHQISFQLKSAPSTANVVKRCAKFLNYEVYLEFEWRNNPNAFQPGKKGLLTFSNKVRQSPYVKPTSKDQAWAGKGVSLPEGTQLKMHYNGQKYTGEIENGYWVLNGNIYKSPSAASNDLARTKEGTRTQLNGWKYWKVKRPEDKNWQFLDSLRISKSDTSELGHIDLDIEIDEIKFD